MNLICPFRGLRPLPQTAANIAAPNYHVWDGDDEDGNEYARVRHFIGERIASGLLRRDAHASYYAYRVDTTTHAQTGLVLLASIQAYRDQRIKCHEHTLPERERDCVRYMRALEIQTLPAMLAYPAAPIVDCMLAEVTQVAAESILSTNDGACHSIWPITKRTLIDELTLAFDALPALFIADGHHRIAAANSLSISSRSTPTREHVAGRPDGFLAVAFPHHQMRILEYNRVVADLNGMRETRFLERILEHFEVIEVSEPVRPMNRGEFGLYLPGRWYRLRVHKSLVPLNDPVGRLDVSVLTHRLFEPILSIGDLRYDRRVEFVDGSRGPEEVERRVAAGMAAGFTLRPVAMQDFMQLVAQGNVMPPKSTCFDPKVADLLVSHVWSTE